MRLYTAIPIFIAFGAWTMFLVVYSFRARWWKTAIGRNVFWVSFLINVILARITAVTLFPSLKDVVWFGASVYLAVALAGLWRMRLMLKAQHEGPDGVAREAEQYRSDDHFVKTPPV